MSLCSQSQFTWGMGHSKTNFPCYFNLYEYVNSSQKHFKLCCALQSLLHITTFWMVLWSPNTAFFNWSPLRSLDFNSQNFLASMAGGKEFWEEKLLAYVLYFYLLNRQVFIFRKEWMKKTFLMKWFLPHDCFANKWNPKQSIDSLKFHHQFILGACMGVFSVGKFLMAVSL